MRRRFEHTSLGCKNNTDFGLEVTNSVSERERQGAIKSFAWTTAGVEEDGESQVYFQDDLVALHRASRENSRHDCVIFFFQTLTSTVIQ